MSLDLTLELAELRATTSQMEGFSESDKVLLGCLTVANALKDIRVALGPGAPEVNVMAVILKAAQNLGSAINSAAWTVSTERGV